MASLPPPPEPPSHRQGPAKTPWYRKTWAPVTGAAVVALLAGVGIGAAGGSTNTPKPVGAAAQASTAHETVTATATVTATPTQVVSTAQVTTTVTYTPAPISEFTAGTYLVGSEIQPGLYKTTDPTGAHCYWERKRDLSGGVGSIAGNDNISGQTTIQVFASDKAVLFSGPCAWAKVG